MRQWRASDREPFARLNRDPTVMAFFPSLLERTESDALVDRIQGVISKQGWGLWAVELAETKTFMGFVGLHIPAVDLPCSPCVEIGWRLAHAYWGKGYATEAAREALRFGFNDLGLDEIVSYTSVQNERSRRVIKRLNMCEDPDTFDHPQVPVQRGLRQHCLYRLSQQRWLESRHN